MCVSVPVEWLMMTASFATLGKKKVIHLLGMSNLLRTGFVRPRPPDSSTWAIQDNQ